jgi:hypothetical protein
MNPSNESLNKLEEEYNQVLREHDLQSQLAFNRIKTIQKRMLKSNELTRAKSSATLDKQSEEMRNRIMKR